MRLVDRLSSIPTATGGIARLTRDRLRDAGIDPAPVMLAAGLSMEDVDDRKRRLDASVQLRVLDLAAEALQDDCFGFRLACDFDLGKIGLLYYVMASSDRLAVRYIMWSAIVPSNTKECGSGSVRSVPS